MSVFSRVLSFVAGFALLIGSICIWKFLGVNDLICCLLGLAGLGGIAAGITGDRDLWR